MTLSNYAQSVKARLLNMADGDNKRYQQLVVRYFHERLLFRLSRSPYRERFILKGGALLYAFEKFTPRPTLDIDFMGSHINNNRENIRSTFKEILKSEDISDGVLFLPSTMTAENITVEKRYPRVRIIVVATLGTYSQKITLDVGFGDVIIPHPMEIEYPTLFSSMETPNILAYSLETVVAEKFQTMIIRGRFNSRMKDYFDLYRIFSAHQFDDKELMSAIAATFSNRNTTFIEDEDFFSENYGNDFMLNQQWQNYIRKMKLELPPFTEVMAFLRPHLRPYWERLNPSQGDNIN